MNLKELYKVIAKREGKKSEVSIGNIREIVGIIADILVKHPKTVSTLYRLGQRRAKKNKGKK